MKIHIPLLLLLILTFYVFVMGCARQEQVTAGGKPGPSPLYWDAATLSEEAATRTQDMAAQTWQVHPGLLRAQIERWATSAGYQVVWKVSRDYHLQSHAQFEGTLTQALHYLFTGLQQRGHSLQVIVYQGNNVILVSEQ